VVGVIIE